MRITEVDGEGQGFMTDIASSRVAPGLVLAGQGGPSGELVGGLPRDPVGGLQHRLLAEERRVVAAAGHICDALPHVLAHHVHPARQ